MKKDWIFTVENSVCDLRTVGVLIKFGYCGVRNAFGNGRAKKLIIFRFIT